MGTLHTQFFMFPALQQYGLIYRARMTSLGFDAKETTIIVNVVMTLSSLVGKFETSFLYKKIRTFLRSCI